MDTDKGDVIRFPIERRCTNPTRFRFQHFTCASCGGAGFKAMKKPRPGAVVCGNCGHDQWVEDASGA